MKRRLSLVFVLAFLAFVAGSSLAQAQEILMGNIPFDFVAGGRAHPAGRYELQVSDDGQTLALMPEGRGAAVELLPLGRLALDTSGPSHTRLVFDKVGNTLFLSEAWFPGEDGYELHVTKEPHAHETVEVGGARR